MRRMIRFWIKIDEERMLGADLIEVTLDVPADTTETQLNESARELLSQYISYGWKDITGGDEDDEEEDEEE